MKEISPHKENIILINKADLLTTEQRQAWAAYFEKEGIKVVFWSALVEAQRLAEVVTVCYLIIIFFLHVCCLLLLQLIFNSCDMILA